MVTRWPSTNPSLHSRLQIVGHCARSPSAAAPPLAAPRRSKRCVAGRPRHRSHRRGRGRHRRRRRATKLSKNPQTSPERQTHKRIGTRIAECWETSTWMTITSVQTSLKLTLSQHPSAMSNATRLKISLCISAETCWSQ